MQEITVVLKYVSLYIHYTYSRGLLYDDWKVLLGGRFVTYILLYCGILDVYETHEVQ